MTEYAYRYEDCRWSPGVDEWGDPLPGCNITVELREFEIIKHTPKGIWIEHWGSKRFVLLTARKRYACLTVEEAKESFIARKQAQIRIYKNRVQIAEAALSIATEGVTKRKIYFMGKYI